MDISHYLPIHYTTSDEAEYCGFMQSALESFSAQDNYHFAYMANHLLFMYQLYLRLWQLSKISPERVSDALSLIHFDDREGKPFGSSLKEIVENAPSPMTFKIFKVEERVFVKILTLLECTDYKPFKKAVDLRNSLAHPNPSLPIKGIADYGDKTENLMQLMSEMHTFSKNVIAHYTMDVLRRRGYTRPYAETEVINDTEQLFVAALMLSPIDCKNTGEILLQSGSKLNRIAGNYLTTLAPEVT